MEECTRLTQLLNLTIKDLNAGGELSLLHQIIEMKNDLKQLVMSKEQAMQHKILDLQNRLKQQDSQFMYAVPESKVQSTQQLVSQLDNLTAHYRDLQAKRNLLLEEVNKLTEDQRNVSTSKLSQAQQIERKVQLYHELTGVYWENNTDEQVGYVLSEEVAQPIRYDPNGTQQLWEMIDM